MCGVGLQTHPATPCRCESGCNRKIAPMPSFGCGGRRTLRFFLSVILALSLTCSRPPASPPSPDTHSVRCLTPSVGSPAASCSPSTPCRLPPPPPLQRLLLLPLLLLALLQPATPSGSCRAATQQAARRRQWRPRPLWTSGLWRRFAESTSPSLLLIRWYRTKFCACEWRKVAVITAAIECGAGFATLKVDGERRDGAQRRQGFRTAG